MNSVCCQVPSASAGGTNWSETSNVRRSRGERREGALDVVRDEACGIIGPPEEASRGRHSDFTLKREENAGEVASHAGRILAHGDSSHRRASDATRNRTLVATTTTDASHSCNTSRRSNARPGSGEGPHARSGRETRSRHAPGRPGPGFGRLRPFRGTLPTPSLQESPMSDDGMQNYDNILQTVGNTPLVRLNKISRGLPVPLYAKLESFNPGGSAKDRIGVSMIEAALKDGHLKPGGPIVECTSGNTGVGLSMASCA